MSSRRRSRAISEKAAPERCKASLTERRSSLIFSLLQATTKEGRLQVSSSRIMPAATFAACGRSGEQPHERRRALRFGARAKAAEVDRRMVRRHHFHSPASRGRFPAREKRSAPLVIHRVFSRFLRKRATPMRANRGLINRLAGSDAALYDKLLPRSIRLRANHAARKLPRSHVYRSNRLIQKLPTTLR